MMVDRFKSFLVAAFSVLALSFSLTVTAQHPGTDQEVKNKSDVTHAEMGNEDSEKLKGGNKIDAAEVIMEHIMDNHEYHFADINGHAISIPLPIILYSKERGFDAFMSSHFEHGHANYNGYKLDHNHIVPVHADGTVDERVKLYDFSLHHE